MILTDWCLWRSARVRQCHAFVSALPAPQATRKHGGSGPWGIAAPLAPFQFAVVTSFSAAGAPAPRFLAAGAWRSERGVPALTLPPCSSTRPGGFLCALPEKQGACDMARDVEPPLFDMIAGGSFSAGRPDGSAGGDVPFVPGAVRILDDFRHWRDPLLQLTCGHLLPRGVKRCRSPGNCWPECLVGPCC
jgi:hypothetical protein